MYLKLSTQNFSNLVKSNIFKLGVERRGVENLMENWPYLGNGER